MIWLLNGFVLCDGNCFYNHAYISSHVLTDPDLRYCNHILAFSFSERKKFKSNYIHIIILISTSVINFLKSSSIKVWIFKLKTMKNRQKLNDTMFEIKMWCITRKNYAWKCSCSSRKLEILNCPRLVVKIL